MDSLAQPREMRVGSLCSGISADSVAWRPLGWKHRWFAEIDKFCCAVLKHHHPETPNYGDFTKRTDFDPIDLLMVSTPCQDFSVAGRRAGMGGARGSLTLSALATLERTRPRWLVFENVPGLLQSDCALGFREFLSGLAERGYGFAYRVSDAQYAGLAQRRERVFLVGYLGDWRPAAAVFLDAYSLQGHPAPSRETRERVAPTLSARTKGGGGLGTDFDLDGGPIPDTAYCLNAKGGSGRIDGESETFISTLRGISDYGDGMPCLRAKGGDCAGGSEALIAHTLRADGFDASEDGTGRGTPLVPVYPILEAGARTGKSTDDPRAGIGIGGPEDPMYTLQSAKQHAVAFTERGREQGRTFECQEELAYCLTNPGSGGRTHSRSVAQGMAVRRLTPRECERLQGFPDDCTLIPEYRKKQKETGGAAEALYAYLCRTDRGMIHAEFRDGRVWSTPDGPRYKALGNSIAVPELRWIGQRIQMIESILRERV